METMTGIKFGLFAACLLMTGCLTPAPKNEGPCWSCDDQRMVRIKPTGREAASSQDRPFNHPLSLEKNQWEWVVRSVYVRSIHWPLLGPSYNGIREPAFAEDEVQYLADALQRAFQEATAQQRIVFALAKTGEAGLTQLTSGAWFVDQGQIHLQLANYQVTVTMPSIRKQIWSNPLAAQPGIFYELVPGDHQNVLPSAQAGNDPFRSEPTELAIDYGAVIGEASSPASTPSGVTPSSPATPSLEDSLGQLKRLYEQGLITEEDYRTKKQQLLDRL